MGTIRPEIALLEQIQRYRRMTGEQRLAIALELHELSCNIAREGIRAQHPQANDAEVEHLLHRRLELARRWLNKSFLSIACGDWIARKSQAKTASSAALRLRVPVSPSTQITINQ
jgi:hypothetical protein